MAVYEYHCKFCSLRSEVTRPIINCDDPHTCPTCGAPLSRKDRIITSKQFYGAKADNAYFSVAAGKWVSGDREMKRIAKAKGWKEVGNTDPEKLLTASDKYREDRAQARYDSLTAPIEVRSE